MQGCEFIKAKPVGCLQFQHDVHFSNTITAHHERSFVELDLNRMKDLVGGKCHKG